MNGYEIVKVQPIHRKGEQVRENILSPVSTIRDDLYGLILEIFYFLSDFFFCPEDRFTYCRFAATFHLRDLLVCKSKFMVQDKAPPLKLRQVLNRQPQLFIPQAVKGCVLNTFRLVQSTVIERFISQVRLFSVPLIPAAQIALGFYEA